MNNLKNEISANAKGVSIEKVNFSFGTNHVLKDINLGIKPGEFFTFLGPSGCGKTTLLRLIAGFGAAQAGRVYIGEQEVTHLHPWERNVGMVFQNYALWPHMTVWRNVAFGLEERKMLRVEIDRKVEAALELVDMLDLADRRPAQLSGGQQQRVALARTVVVEPQVLLLDEPLSNLDAKLRVQMRREILALQRKLSITTIFVTHDQEEANTMADRIALMKDGVIQQVGAPIELYDKPVNRFVADFLGTANFIDGKLEKTGTTIKFHADNGLVIPLNNVVLNKDNLSRYSLVFRPQNVKIDTTESETNVENTIKLRGFVSSKEFLGSILRYSVKVRNEEILVDVTRQQGQSPLTTGTKVNLYINQDQIILVSE